MVQKISSLFILISFIFLGCENNDEIRFFGNFEADEFIVPSSGAGKLIQLKVAEGEYCKKGDTLAIIDTTILSLERSKMRTSLKALQEMGMFSQMEPLRIELMIIQEKIRMSYIISPMNSKILKINFREGEYLFEGSPLMSIVDDSHIFFVAWVPGSHLSEISAGDSVMILSDLPKGKMDEHKARVKSVSERPQFVPSMVQTKENRTEQHYCVKVEMINDGSLKGGMPGELIPKSR